MLIQILRVVAFAQQILLTVVFHNKREKPLTSEEAALITSFPPSDMILDAVLISFPSLKLILVCVSVIRAIIPSFSIDFLCSTIILNQHYFQHSILVLCVSILYQHSFIVGYVFHFCISVLSILMVWFFYYYTSILSLRILCFSLLDQHSFIADVIFFTFILAFLQYLCFVFYYNIIIL